MKTLAKTLIIVLAGIVIACNQNTQQTASNNRTSETNSISGDSVTACPHSSNIFWSCSRPGRDHNGLIKLKQGEYIVENGKLVGGNFLIDMNSIADMDMENEEMIGKLVNHLKSNDFFSVDSFPLGKFIITKIEEISDDKFSHQITGDLTLKSITHPITFKAKINVGEGVVSASSEQFFINRTLWNINYQSKTVFTELKDKFINDEIGIQIEAHSM